MNERDNKEFNTFSAKPTIPPENKLSPLEEAILHAKPSEKPEPDRSKIDWGTTH